MAKFRQVHTSFWQDPFILDLSAEEKYFYLYCLTNTKTAACGVYELPLTLMKLETGLQEEKITDLLKQLEDTHKIRYSYETKEILILNWFKYNDYKSPNTLKCIQKELDEIKNPEFKSFLENYLKTKTTPYKGLIRGLQGATKPLPSKQIHEKEKESSSLDQTSKVDNDNDDLNSIRKTLKFWGVSDIETLIKLYSIEDLQKAISMATDYKASNPGAYFRTLLRNKASLELKSHTKHGKSNNGKKERCEALRVIDSWKEENPAEKPSQEEIIEELLQKGKKEEARQLMTFWNIKPKPT